MIRLFAIKFVLNLLIFFNTNMQQFKILKTPKDKEFNYNV